MICRQHSLFLCAFYGSLSTGAFGQPILLFKQSRDGELASPMTAAETAELGDPFFRLVLADHSDLTNLAEIEKAIQPDPEKRTVFVVHENIKDDRPGQGRRAVISFQGVRPGPIALDANVMLSVFFDSDQFSDTPSALEVWGWDDQRGRYNYYKLDNSGSSMLAMTWKFRGSSVGADQMDDTSRSGTCMACHINGGPVMKELLFPWNNWHSDISRSPAEYLLAGRPNAWPVASHARLRKAGNGGLSDAANLETSLLAAVRQFNRRRIDEVLHRAEDDGTEALPAGQQAVVEGRRLLRPLFATTEYNIISARQRSGLHALPSLDSNGPSEEVVIPNSFFLNAELLAGGGQTPGHRGLGLSMAKEFGGIVRLQPAEYKNLVRDGGLQLHGKPSDAHFAWLVPEPSHIDNDMVDQIMRRGIASPQFVAAALAIDLENPVLSRTRANLLRFVPDRFAFTPLEPAQNHLQHFVHPDSLTRSTIAALDAAQPGSGTPEADWLQLLRDPDPIARLGERIVAYRDRVKGNLDHPQRRAAELQRIFARLIERRRAVNRDPVLSSLDETGGSRLFPIPTD